MIDEKTVEFMYKCPFMYEELYDISEVTCDCQLKGRPLKEAGSITVTWRCE